VKRSDLWTFAATGGAVAVAGVSDLAELTIFLRFVSAVVALGLLAMLIGRSTEQIGHHLSAGATGVLQSSVGNLPELFVGIFSLRAGLLDVVRASLVGSILANSLLIFGIAILVGGLKHGRQRFSRERARVGATLLLLAVSAMVIPTLVHQLHSPAEGHIAALSGASAALLLLSFGASVAYALGAKADLPLPDAPIADTTEWPLKRSVVTLVVSGFLAAFVSEWFVAALVPLIHTLGLSQAFAGFVLVAIAGNAVENVVGIQLALKNKADYAVSVILNSSLQVALALVPALVLLSFVIGGPVLTLELPPLLVMSLLMTVLIIALIVGDGESIWLEGVPLIGLYGMIAGSLWWD
jgi:Ca2+:H+ antiporter